MKNAINHICNKYFENYQDQSLRFLLDDMKSEYDLITKYSGRELLELLQNADDAGGQEVQIRLTKDSLSISNSGIPFDISNFERLCQGKVSGKDKKYIGSKGIGFRSIWNWAEEVSIESGDSYKCISVLFSKAEAKKKLDQLLEKKDIKQHIQEQLQEFKQAKDAEPEYPVMKNPIYRNPTGHRLTTEITVKIRNEAIYQKILDDIKFFDKYILIFLPNITNIEFYVNDKLVNEIEKTGIEKVSINDISGINEKFIVNSIEIQVPEISGFSKTLKMSVALPEKGFVENQCLYSFFPIKNVPSPFKALLHATFCLTDNRNSLDDSKDEYKKNNRIVFGHLLDFYIDTIIDKVNDERRLEFLLPVNFYSCNSYSFPGNFEGINTLEYFNKIVQKAIFYSNQDSFMMASDSPILIKNPPLIVKNVLHDKLLKNSSDEELYTFEEELLKLHQANFFILQEDRIKKEIENNLDSLSDENRIEIFKWWFDNHHTSMLKILKDDKGNFIEDETIPCFLSSEGIKQIPDWAKSKIAIINSADEHLLLKKFEKEILAETKPNDKNPKRLLPRLLKRVIYQFNIQEQSSRQVIISPVNQAVGNNYERAKDFIKWLWNIWKKAEFDSVLKNIDYVVPTRNQSVKNAKNTYLGKEYGNELGEKLFSNSKEYWAIEPLEIESDDEKIQCEKFLTFIGVMKLPQLISRNFKFYKSWSTVNDTAEIKNYTRKYVNKLVEQYSPVSGFNTNQDISANLQSVTNLDTILQLDDNIIFEWLFSCDSIRNTILSTKELETSSVEYIPYKCSTYSNYYPTTKAFFFSYLHFIFSNTKWIMLKGNKYSPNELFLTEDPIYEQYFSLKSISEKDLKEKLEKLNQKNQNNISRDNFKIFLKSLGMKTSILEFDSNKFYEILLKLPDLKEKSFKTSRAIYRSIIDNYQDEDQIHNAFYKDSDNKTDFFKNGKVLAKTKTGISKYESIKNVCFSSSAVYCLSEKLFIDVPTRMGKAEDFKNVFNIYPPDENYNIVVKKESELNFDFKNDLKSYLPALMTFRKNPDLTDINRLQIILAEEVNIDGVQFKGDKYTLFKQTKNFWVIYIGNENEYQKVNKDKIANCFVQVFNVFFNYPAKEFLEKAVTLFIYQPEYRKSLVENELGSIQELEEIQEKIKDDSEIRNEIAVTICKNLGNENDSETLNFVKSINWSAIDIPNTQEDIYSFLIQKNKDLKWLNIILEMNISLDSFHKWKINCIWEERKKGILDCIYSNLVNKSIEEKKRFKQLVKLMKEEIENLKSIDFFVKSHDDYFNEVLSNSFKINNLTESLKSESYEIYYRDNIETVKVKLLAENIDRFCSNQEYESLLYFNDEETNNEIERIITLLLTEIEKEKDEEEKDKKQSDLFSGIFNNIQEGSSELESGVPLYTGTSGAGIVTPNNQDKKNRRNKKQGNYAEYFVVLRLCNSLIPEVTNYLGEGYSIKWVSGAAKLITKFDFDKFGYSIDETNDGAGYDIEVISSDKQKKLYIEVKSSSGSNCSFRMSSNEKVKAGELDNGLTEKYRIIFVSNLDIGNPNCIPEIHYIDEKIDDKNIFDSIPTEYNIIYKNEK